MYYRFEVGVDFFCAEKEKNPVHQVYILPSLVWKGSKSWALVFLFDDMSLSDPLLC